MPLKTPTENLSQLRAVCERFAAAASHSSNTLVCYASDVRLFERWCRANRLKSDPPSGETLSLYVASMIESGKRIRTALRHLAAIKSQYKRAGTPLCDAGLANAVLAGAQRLLCEQPRQKRPLTIEEVRKIALACDTRKPKDIRDRAIIVMGFASALRRVNITDLDMADVEIERRGIVLKIRREKQDRKSVGRLIGLPRGASPHTCPVKCLNEWLDVRGRGKGALFTRMSNGERLRPPTIATIVRNRAFQIGLDGHSYGGHSLRSGLVTEAAERGVGDHVIAAQTGHRKMDTLRTYFRRTDLWRSNAAAMIGL